MQLNVVKKQERAMLDRTELTFEIGFTGAVPSREEIKKKIAGMEGVKENVVIIKKIKAAVGFGRAVVEAYIYKDEASMGKIEYEYAIKRGSSKKEAGKEGEAKTEAKPAEEKKE